MAPPPPQPPYGAPYGPMPMSPADEKMWATLVHIGGVFFGFLPALIGYLILRDRGPFVRAHTAQALNFQLTVLIGLVAGGILVFLLIGVLVLIVVAVLDVVYSIIAGVKAGQGQWYRYPMTIQFVR
ncbi:MULTISPECIES: DUF4870 domain-containing protein [unclassified Microbacterium]|uniref:DUF4870 domain-containing protein n=1 Tax=unclassified Microbacterium TaxID=2609290 RepID=UPI00214B4CC7|nr:MULTISPECIES: DUF4870 domain-containing protein [unclassified Microbacterium]MCR2783317.1 DUF4870 domain-containing protein [Microbacterium sp. zg.B96]WIM17664.1 DUF4870 domain-containing protein [Microbacterium sp. zg-B96]